MKNTKNTLKQRRNFVYENVNEEIASKDKPVSRRERSKIYKKWWKAAIRRFPLKK